MESQTVDRSEMSLQPSELLLVHQMEETRIELAGLRRSGGHLHGILSAAQHHMLQIRTDRRRIDWPLRFVGLQQNETLRVEQLGRRVLAGRHEHRAIARQLHVVDNAGVVLDRVQLLAVAQIEHGQLAVLVTRNHLGVQAAPQHGRDLRIADRNAQNRFGIREAFVDVAHVNDHTFARLSHRRVRRVCGLIARIAEVYGSHGRFAGYGRNRLSGLHVPDPGRIEK